MMVNSQFPSYSIRGRSSVSAMSLKKDSGTLNWFVTYRGLAVYPCVLFVTYCFYFSRNTVVHNLSLLFTAAKIEKSGNKCISEADFCQVRETAYLR
mgnify:CR=1 FL=1